MTAFHQLCDDLGACPYVPNPANRSIDAALDEIIRRWRLRIDAHLASCPQGTALDFGFIQSPDLNAVAARTKIGYAIGINLGTIFIINRLFNLLLSNPRTFPNIGNPTKETALPDHLPDLDRLTLDLEANLRGEALLKPRDEQRQVFSAALYTLAINFVFHHEVGHILNGHVGWLSEKQGLLSISEKNVTPQLQGLNRQTLEMDADAFAIGDILRHAIFLMTTARGLPLDQATDEDHRAGAALAVASTYGVFRLFFGHDTYDMDAILRHNHPPMYFRVMYFIDSARKTWEQQLKRDPEEFRNIAIDMAMTTDTAVNIVSGKTQSLDLTKRATIDSMGTLAAMLLDNWKVLRPQLVKHALCIELAP